MMAARGGDVDPVQERLLRLLKELDAICGRHDITYYLSGGSVIGAMRNEGFLPWDDDIDVFMTRSNWERLLGVIDEELLPDRELVCLERFPAYANPIPRYMDTASTAIHKHMVVTDVPRGQCIDFFLLDPLPDEEAAARRQQDLFAVWAELLCPYFMVNRRTGLDSSPLSVELYRHYSERAQREGREAVLREIEKELFTHAEEDCARYYLRWGVKRVIYDKDLYGQPRMVPFEGMSAPVASRVFEALRIDYGDGWRIVPEEGHRVVHDLLVHDLDTPYQRYVDDYRSFIPRNAIEVYRRRKRNAIEEIGPREMVQAGMAQLEALCVRMTIERRLQEAGVDLDALVSGRRCDELRLLFSGYYRVQFSGLLKQSAVPVGLDDRLLNAALLPLLLQGEYFHAVDAFILRERVGLPLSGGLSDLRRLLDDIRALTLALDYEDHARASELVASIEREWPESVYVARARLRLGVMRLREDSGASSEQVAGAVTAARKALGAHPADGECMKYLADALVMSGQPEEARGWYNRALAATRDGMVLLGIRKALDRLSCVRASADSTAPETPPGDEGQQLTPAHGRLLCLLDEIDRICREDSLQYFLTGRTALCACRFGRLCGDPVPAEVAMSPADARRFAEIVASRIPANRCIEWESASSALGDARALYYCDEASTCIDSDVVGTLDHPGIRVAICVVTSPRLLSAGGAGGGRIGLLRRLRDALTAAREGGAVRLARIHAPGRMPDTYTAASCLRHRVGVALAGRTYPVPGVSGDAGVTEHFLADVGGVNWRRRDDLDVARASQPLVCAVDIPHADFLAAARDTVLPGEAWLEARRDYRRRHAAVIPDLWLITRFQRVAARSGDRLALRRQYGPLKSEILRVRDDGDDEVLGELLQPYLVAAARNASRGLGLCFDRDLLGVLVDYLRRTGEARLARWLHRRVPRAHRRERIT